NGDDLFVIDLAFLEDLVIGSEHGEVAAARTPGRVIGGDGFLREFLARKVCRRHACRYRAGDGCCFFAHKITGITAETSKSQAPRLRCATARRASSREAPISKLQMG